VFCIVVYSGHFLCCIGLCFVRKTAGQLENRKADFNESIRIDRLKRIGESIGIANRNALGLLPLYSSPYTITITLLHTVTSMLTRSPYVRVVALDFSKVFDIDSVRHCTTLLQKLSNLSIPDEDYKNYWIRDCGDVIKQCALAVGLM